jgi:hypothetical protein
MATINNSDDNCDLRPNGIDLFSDSEGYLDELDDNELESVHGGFTPVGPLAFRATIYAMRSTQQCAMATAQVFTGF